jgi:hypothetical protein
MYCDFSNTDLREKIATIRCPSLIVLEFGFSNFKEPLKYKNLKLQFSVLKGLHFIMYDDAAWYLAPAE